MLKIAGVSVGLTTPEKFVKGKSFVVPSLVGLGLLASLACPGLVLAQTPPASPAPVASAQTPVGQTSASPAPAPLSPTAGPSIYQTARPPVNPLNPSANSLLVPQGQPARVPEGGVPVPPSPPTFQQQNQPASGQPAPANQAPAPGQYPSAPYSPAPYGPAPHGSAQYGQSPYNQVPYNPAGYQPPVQPTALPPNALPEPLPELPTPAQKNSFYNEQLFNNTAITPAEIRELNKALDARRKALAAPATTPPRPSTGTIVVSLEPGSTPPILRPYYGEVTSFSVVDNTGAPWPVENFRVGNAQLFSINRLDGPQGSVFTIDALDNYGQSNLVLKLKGLDTPVVIGLIAGQPRYDSRVAVRIDRRGPHASVMQGTSLPPGVSSSLLSVADGVAPPSGKLLTIEGDAGKTRGWLMPDHTMIVLTPLTIISPASRSFFSSGDGYNVYVFQAIPVLQGIYNHQEVTLSVTHGL